MLPVEPVCIQSCGVERSPGTRRGTRRVSPCEGGGPLADGLLVLGPGSATKCARGRPGRPGRPVPPSAGRWGRSFAGCLGDGDEPACPRLRIDSLCKQTASSRYLLSKTRPRATGGFRLYPGDMRTIGRDPHSQTGSQHEEGARSAYGSTFTEECLFFVLSCQSKLIDSLKAAVSAAQTPDTSHVSLSTE